MRAVLVALLILALVPAAPAASAAPLAEDPEGDVQVANDAGAPPVPLSHEELASTDLVGLEILEDEDALTFVVKVKALRSTLGGASSYDVYFTWGEREYWIDSFYVPSGSFNPDGAGYAYLRVREGESWAYVAELADVQADEGAATFAMRVDKVYVSDRLNRVPGRGDSIEAIHVESTRGSINIFARFTIADRMPDAGDAGGFQLQMGDYATGNLALATPERVRVSNGGSTTFVFPITVRNLGDAEQEFAVAVADLPEGWNATAQSTVKVPAKGEKVVSVLASVPFAHEHGGFSAFNVTVRGVADTTSEGRMRLGVVHTPIPQPAGHHNELFLHADPPGDDPLAPAEDVFGRFAWGWMNTEADHANDGPVMTPNGRYNDYDHWNVWLSPGLQLGLDFNVDELGSLVGSIEGKRDGDAELLASLYYYSDSGNGGESILLAEAAPTTITLASGAPTPFTVDLTPTMESDYIPYTRDAYVYLEIALARDVVQDVPFAGEQRTPLLRTEDFKLTLPLNEYHDRLTGVADVAQSLEITAVGPVEKTGRPGTTLTYAFDVKNLGGDATYVIDLAGNEASLATVVPAGAHGFASGETKRVTLGVQVPVGSAEAQEIEVLLFVHGQDDPSRMAIARTKTMVTLSGDAAADETGALLAAQAEYNETPGPGLLLVAAAVGVALVAARRR